MQTGAGLAPYDVTQVRKQKAVQGGKTATHKEDSGAPHGRKVQLQCAQPDCSGHGSKAEDAHYAQHAPPIQSWQARLLSSAMGVHAEGFKALWQEPDEQLQQSQLSHSRQGVL